MKGSIKGLLVAALCLVAAVALSAADPIRIGFFAPEPFRRAIRLSRLGSEPTSFYGMPSRSSTP